MTIEACVVVPIAMVVLVSIIYLAYFVHDKAVMTAVNDFALMENAGNADAGNASQMISSALSQNLYSVSSVSASSGGGTGNMNADSGADFYMPLVMIRNIMGQNTEMIRSKVRISFLASRKKLLLYKSICDGVPELLKEAAGKK